MGKFDGLLLASDFDDTLFDGGVSIPGRNLEAIRYFTGEGGYFTVATGLGRASGGERVYRRG